MSPFITRILVSLLAFVDAAAHAADFFVFPAGNDLSLGTLAQPFHSLERVETVAKAGDTVFLRAGTYYETLSPANSGKPGAPIRFLAYNSEEVTIHGGTPVTKWTKLEGNIYVGKVAEPVSDVFVNRHGMSWARHPNLIYNARDGFSARWRPANSIPQFPVGIKTNGGH